MDSFKLSFTMLYFNKEKNIFDMGNYSVLVGPRVFSKNYWLVTSVATRCRASGPTARRGAAAALCAPAPRIVEVKVICMIQLLCYNSIKLFRKVEENFSCDSRVI